MAKDRGKRAEITVDLTSRMGVKQTIADVLSAGLAGQISTSLMTACSTLLNTALRLSELELEVRLAQLEAMLEDAAKQQRRPGASR